MNETINLPHLLHLAWLVPGFPFLAFLLNFFVFRNSSWIAPKLATLAIFSSSVVAWKIFLQVWNQPSFFAVDATNVSKFSSTITWLPLNPGYANGGFNIEIGVFLDPLSVMMITMVSTIATLIHLYSIGYMYEDPSIVRFFLYLSLFTFSMLGLVLGNNFMQMFVFWELVGLCSYLLIGFYINKKSAGDAAKKAFIVTRFADFGFLAGLVLLAYVAHDFNYFTLAAKIELLSKPVQIFAWAIPSFLPIFTLLIFMGAMGKSGQFPFHVWLPDAMEGPTPVSALIHAATMVTAGVFMLARCFPLFFTGHQMEIVAWIGGFTALFAATIATVQFDIKKILAYSTLSQLGYMVMAMGIEGSVQGGNPATGVFHLFTHAFFKALLFLGAGSLIHAVHSNDIRKMGGMFSHMKITSLTFLIGSLALAGFWPFAGFFSKDAILHSAHVNHFEILYLIGSLAAFLTAFYMGRACFMVFTGEYRGHHTPHESPFTMTIPLIILAFFSITAGFAHEHFTVFLSAGKIAPAHLDLVTAVKSILIASLGVFIAWLLYGKKILPLGRLTNTFSPFYHILVKKYYLDEFWEFCVKKMLLPVGFTCAIFDKKFVDGVLVDGWAWLTQGSSKELRLTQTGVVQTYVFIGMFFALVFFVIIF